MSTKKRKVDSNGVDDGTKRLKGGDGSVKVTATVPAPEAPKRRIKKLVPTRPFPRVGTSVSATGPQSAHREGKNYICITRKTSVGRYMRRCKDIIMEDGYKTLHLHAMGAAIPHLAMLSVALVGILPFGEVVTEVRTGTVEVQDEVVPEEEEEDISYQTRDKSTLSVVVKIGDGGETSKGVTASKVAQVVYEEPEQMDCD